ncbi:NAC domain-containing protein [Psidium guajava]|nr:NAC domain-containing protein [Psidium guajava]
MRPKLSPVETTLSGDSYRSSGPWIPNPPLAHGAASLCLFSLATSFSSSATHNLVCFGKIDGRFENHPFFFLCGQFIACLLRQDDCRFENRLSFFFEAVSGAMLLRSGCPLQRVTCRLGNAIEVYRSTIF